jgi:hypothetical protein
MTRPKGFRRTLADISEQAVETLAASDGKIGTRCVFRIKGKTITNSKGEVMIGLDAESNIPTEPVAAEAKVGWNKRRLLDRHGEWELEWELVLIGVPTAGPRLPDFGEPSL